MNIECKKRSIVCTSAFNNNCPNHLYAVLKYSLIANSVIKMLIIGLCIYCLCIDSIDFQDCVNDLKVSANESIFFPFVRQMTHKNAQKRNGILIKMQKSLLNPIYA